MEYFEYSLIFGLNDGLGQERDFLKRWGAEGWELVCIAPAGFRRYPQNPPGLDNAAYVFYYFKRPLERRGILGRFADAVSTALVWGRSRTPTPAATTVPGQEQPAAALDREDS